MDERQRRELEKVEFEYMDAYDRGDYPTLEELILRYPGPENGELRAGIAEFVLDYIELTNAARRVELTEAELADAQVIQERAIRRCLGQVENQTPRGD